MGVNHLWAILEPIRQHCQLQNLKNKTLAIDLAGWIVENRNCKAIQKTNIKKPHLRNLFFRISHLIQLGINIIFVLDGKAPELKADTIYERIKSKNKNSGTQQVNKAKRGCRTQLQADLRECREMLDFLGIPYVQSEGEAEAMCAFLNYKRMADGCVTDDGDAFLYGAQTIYRNFTLDAKDSHVDCYLMSDVEDKLHLSREKLISLAILLGCDYFKGVPGIGKETAIQFLNRCQDDDILKRFDDWVTMKDSEETPLILDIKKLPHCKACNHLGSVQQHLKSGCKFCKSLIGCEAKSELTCSCDWHNRKPLIDIWKLESTIRQKALATPGFPGKEVVDEFMKCNNKLPETLPKWRKPEIPSFQKFASLKLGWSEEYSFTKILPLVTKWQINNIQENEVNLFKPCRILKKSVKKGMSVFKIQWENSIEYNIPDELLITVEDSVVFASVYPDLYDDFVETKNKTKQLKGKKSSLAISSDPSQNLGKLMKKKKGKHSEIIDLTSDDKENVPDQIYPRGATLQTQINSYFKSGFKNGKINLVSSRSVTSNHLEINDIDFGKDKITNNANIVHTILHSEEVKHKNVESTLQTIIISDDEIDAVSRQMKDCKIASEDDKLSCILASIENLDLHNGGKDTVEGKHDRKTEQVVERNSVFEGSECTENKTVISLGDLAFCTEENSVANSRKSFGVINSQQVKEIPINFSLDSSKLLDFSVASPSVETTANYSIDLFAEENLCNSSFPELQLDQTLVNSSKNKISSICVDLQESPLPLMERIKRKINL